VALTIGERFGYRELPLPMPPNRPVAEMASHSGRSMSDHVSGERALGMASPAASRAAVAREHAGGA